MGRAVIFRRQRGAAAAAWVVLAALCGSPAAARAEDGVAAAPLPDPAELHRRIIARYAAMYTLYKGVEIKSRITSRITDPETDAILERSAVLAVTESYWYAPPKRRALEYAKDGERLDPNSYEHRGNDEPMWPVFDADGERRYRLGVLERVTRRDRPCWLLDVQPREATGRHFRGRIWVDAESLDLVALEGTFADLPFPVQSLEIRYDLRQEGELSVPERGTSRVRVKIPVLHDAWYLADELVVFSRPIPR